MAYRYSVSGKALLVVLILLALLAVAMTKTGIQPTPTQNQTVYVDIKDIPSPKVYIRVEKIGLVTNNGIFFILNNTYNPLELNLTELVNRSRSVGAVVLKPYTNITHVIICIERVIVFDGTRNRTFFKHKFYTRDISNMTHMLNYTQEWEEVVEKFREWERQMWWEGKTPPWWNLSKERLNWTEGRQRIFEPLAPWNITLNSTKCIIVPIPRPIVILPQPVPVHHVVVDVHVDINQTITTGYSYIEINVTKG